ncbi:unnamed protein product [Lampetra planeri]
MKADTQPPLDGHFYEHNAFIRSRVTGEESATSGSDGGPSRHFQSGNKLSRGSASGPTHDIALLNGATRLFLFRCESVASSVPPGGGARARALRDTASPARCLQGLDSVRCRWRLDPDSESRRL